MHKALVLSPLVVALCACGADKPVDKAPENPAATPSSTGTPAAIKPPDASLPNTPSASGVRISNEIKEKCGITDSEAYFAFDSASLGNSYFPPLDKVAVCFTTGPLAGRGLRLVGHADPRGPHDYNLQLGHQRADAVGHYLNGKMDAKHVETTSRGDEDAEGKDEAGYAKDRRVDVMLGQ